MRTSSRRRTRLELQCNALQPCSTVVHVGQGNCFFPANEKEKEEDEVKEQDDKITTEEKVIWYQLELEK